jgi:hypothetical protein
MPQRRHWSCSSGAKMTVRVMSPRFYPAMAPMCMTVPGSSRRGMTPTLMPAGAPSSARPTLDSVRSWVSTCHRERRANQATGSNGMNCCATFVSSQAMVQAKDAPSRCLPERPDSVSAPPLPPPAPPRRRRSSGYMLPPRRAGAQPGRAGSARRREKHRQERTFSPLGS